MECENKRRFADGNAISEFNAKVQYFFYSTNFCTSFIVIYVFFFFSMASFSCQLSNFSSNHLIFIDRVLIYAQKVCGCAKNTLSLHKNLTTVQ